MNESGSASGTHEPILAIGGAPGGIGTPAGWFVAMQYQHGILDVFTQAASHRFHAAFIERIEVNEHPGPSGQQLIVQAGAQGCMVPTRFSDTEHQHVLAIAQAVREVRGQLGPA